MINGVILKLGEKGKLQELKRLWWKEKDGGTCTKDVADKSASTSELGLANVGGVFLVLMCGCVFALIIAIFEFLWNIREVAVREKVRYPLSNLFVILVFYLKLKFCNNCYEINK